jgi:hypothetical protein
MVNKIVSLAACAGQPHHSGQRHFAMAIVRGHLCINCLGSLFNEGTTRSERSATHPRSRVHSGIINSVGLQNPASTHFIARNCQARGALNKAHHCQYQRLFRGGIRRVLRKISREKQIASSK